MVSARGAAERAARDAPGSRAGRGRGRASSRPGASRLSDGRARRSSPTTRRCGPEDGLTVSTWLWLAPGARRGERRALIATWGADGDGWALVLDADGRPALRGRRRRPARLDRRRRAGRGGRLDAARGGARAGDGNDRGRALAPPRSARQRRSRSRVRRPRLAARGRAKARCCSAPSGAAPGVAGSHLDGKLDGPRSRAGRAARTRSPPGSSARGAGRASSTAARTACTAPASTGRCAR